jgi:hypothetical protein
MVGLQTLNLAIGVRVPASQPIKSNTLGPGELLRPGAPGAQTSCLQTLHKEVNSKRKSRQDVCAPSLKLRDEIRESACIKRAHPGRVIEPIQELSYGISVGIRRDERAAFRVCR